MATTIRIESSGRHICVYAVDGKAMTLLGKSPAGIPFEVALASVIDSESVGPPDREPPRARVEETPTLYRDTEE